jgi:hypothetical protein
VAWVRIKRHRCYRRLNGPIVTEHVGRGRVAELKAELDADLRTFRGLDRTVRRLDVDAFIWKMRDVLTVDRVLAEASLCWPIGSSAPRDRPGPGGHPSAALACHRASTASRPSRRSSAMFRAGMSASASGSAATSVTLASRSRWSIGYGDRFV